MRLETSRTRPHPCYMRTYCITRTSSTYGMALTSEAGTGRTINDDDDDEFLMIT